MPPSGLPAQPAATTLPARVGHYSIVRKLGEGGMGIVYAARDERLQRTVAVKTMSSLARDETAQRRFWREARAAASVNHPNICQIHEIGEDNGQLFIAMELLEGEVLSDRLRRGALTLAEVMPIGLGMLSALSALHAAGIVHRDLKPSNVFLTAHGVKLLDFGLARPELEEAFNTVTVTEVTRDGMIVGTPRYMAPEQISGETVDSRGDLFAAAAILFEMLAGRPAFVGRSIVEILHATRFEQPPALTGSPAVAAVDRVIRRALAKRPADRPPSATVMADELRAITGADGHDTANLAHPLTRLVVLPFRVLRPDPETDFLAFSLPDAITTSLGATRSLVLRSSAVAARFAAEAPNLKTLATEADVDCVVMGTLLRAGDQLRVSAQLIEAPSGTVLTSHAVQSSMGDLFQLQDDMARRIVEALSPPLTASTTPSPTLDRPRDARAYELYLRANELARSFDGLPAARDLYLQSLELDSRFAPAWARLGRAYRVIGKFIDGAPDSVSKAEDAFRRALALNPRLSIAHKFYANLEAETGHAEQAIVRLIGEANRHGNDPELFAGLVHACRYAGLFEQSIGAHAEARRLDPNISTGVAQTFLLSGELERLLASDQPVPSTGGDAGIRVIGLGLAGRVEEARERLLAMRDASRIPTFVLWTERLQSWLERREDKLDIAILGNLQVREDPEAIFQEGWLECDRGNYAEGLALITVGVVKGYFVAETLARARQFDALRDNPVFQKVLADAEAGSARALAAFREAGGEQLLGT
jgi:non-specific serine/threonine protein kinase